MGNNPTCRNSYRERSRRTIIATGDNSRLYPAGSPAVILLTCGGTRNMPREPPPPPPNAAPPHRPAPKGRVLHQPPAHRTAPRRSPRSPEEPWVDYWATSTWPNWQPFRPNAPAQVRTKATHPFSVLAVACICLLMFPNVIPVRRRHMRCMRQRVLGYG